MKYKAILVSILSAVLLAGCSSSKDTVDGFLQEDTSSIVKESEYKNEITEDNSEDLADANSKRTDRNDTTKEGIYSNIDKLEDHGQTADTHASSNQSNTQVGRPNEENSLVTEQCPTLAPTKEPTNQSGQSTKPESTVQPTKVPTQEPTQEPTPTKYPIWDQLIPLFPTNQPTVKPTIAPTKQPTPTPTKQPTPTPTKQPTAVPTIQPKPTTAPTQIPSTGTSKSLSVRGVTIAMGESKSSVIDKLGSPSRIDATEYSYDFMVYNNNYSKFVMIAIENSKVVGWYTDSTDFSYDGLTTSSTVSSINSKYQKSLSLNRTLSVTADGRKLTFFMDTLGDKTIDGILVTTTSVTKGSTTDSVLRAWEKEILDLTNSFRARNGLSALSWSDAAAKAARLHSKDMADNNYFSHTGLNGSTPSQRLKAQGISFTASGENIIGGYGNALHSSNGWMNSSGHRSNLLHKSFQYLGVGYVLGGSYGNYATQNFYR